MRILIGIITILAGLPALGGIYLLYKLTDLPTGAVIVIVNAIVFRGICGTAGGVLFWRRSRWGSYLTALSWLYMITVSFMTIIKLYNSGLTLDAEFISHNFSTFGKPLAWSAAKVILGIPIIYYITSVIFKKGSADRKADHSD